MRISVQSEQVDKIVCGSKTKLLFFVTNTVGHEGFIMGIVCSEMMQNMIVIFHSCKLKS